MTKTDLLKVLRRPMITEKNTIHLGANIYTFEVEKDANKSQIARAVEKAFDVDVLSVRTLNCRGRSRRMGRYVSAVPKFKKALVQIAEGQKIKIFEGA